MKPTIIYMRNVPGKPKNRVLTRTLSAEKMDGSLEQIPIDFEWDGSSAPTILQGIFPRHRHPVASCKHDFRCEKAKTPEERKWADKKFKEDVAKTSWRITSWVGYLGVRIGAFFGIGCNYKNNVNGE